MSLGLIVPGNELKEDKRMTCDLCCARLAYSAIRAQTHLKRASPRTAPIIETKDFCCHCFALMNTSNNGKKVADFTFKNVQLMNAVPGLAEMEVVEEEVVIED